MANNLLDQFTDYIDFLCRRHVKINHRSNDIHFMELNSDIQFQRMKTIKYPCVTLDRLSVNYTGPRDGMRKYRALEMMFVDKIQIGDLEGIQTVKKEMEYVAEDFVKKMNIDKRNKIKFPFLKGLVISDIEMNYIENETIGLYGVLLSLNFDLPFIEELDDDRFANDTFGSLFDTSFL